MSDLSTIKLVAGCKLVINGALDLLREHLVGRQVVLQGTARLKVEIVAITFADGDFYFAVEELWRRGNVSQVRAGEIELIGAAPTLAADTPHPAGSAGHPLPQGERVTPSDEPANATWGARLAAGCAE